MTTWSYDSIRHAPLGAYIAITDGQHHVLASAGDPGVPAAAQRRLNAAGTTGKTPAAADLLLVREWLRKHAVQTWQQGCLFDAA